MGRASDPRRQGLRGRPVAGGDARDARHADRARPQQPVPRPPVEENLDLFRRMRAGEFPNGARVLRAKIDMAAGNINLRDPVLLPHPAREPSAHRRHMVHLSELRFRPRPVRRDRGRHAFDLHARVRGPSAALRLVPGQSAGAVAAAAVRVRPAQPRLHGALQARAHRAGARRPCRGLGRSAHADARGPAPPRRAAGGDPRLRPPHRRRQGQQPGRDRAVRTFDPRALEPDRAAAHGGAAPAQGRHRELFRRRRARSSRPSTIRTIRPPARGASASAASSSSSATISWRTRRRSSTACRPDARCGCATPISSPAARW